MSFERAIQAAKAAADTTRLRLLALLAVGEATVGELQEILGQSQPRVSRHLRLLGEAGLVDKFRDGHWVYHRLAAAPGVADVVRKLIDLAGEADEQLTRDRESLAVVKRRRERDAYANRTSAPFIDAVHFGGRPSATDLLDAIDDCIDGHLFGEVLDVGCGTGALLSLLGRRASNVVGVDISKDMRMLARSRVHRSGLANCTVRNGDVCDLPFDDATFDLVVLDEVIIAPDKPIDGLREVSRVLRHHGRLVIIDRIQPVSRRLSPVSGRKVLIESQLTALLSEAGFNIRDRTWFPGRIMEYALFSATPGPDRLRTGTHA
jgi:SAM-dependent methyltransferase